MNSSISLSQALQALPLEAPSESLWPHLQAHLPKQAVWPRWAMAGVASVALVFLSFTFSPNLPWFNSAGVDQQEARQILLEPLIQQSTQLENAFYSQQDDSISSATVIAANLAVEAQLSQIDTQLSTQPGNATSASLWQERIDVLKQGLSLNATNAQFNANGQNLDLVLASIN